METRPISLPFDNITIRHDVNSQAVSSDSEFLYRTILSRYPENLTSAKLQILELGAGNGIIAILLALTNKSWQISALEAQISQFLLARQNIKESKTDIDLILADLRKPVRLQKNNYDLVYANPPYFPAGRVRISPSISKAIARYELLCDMNDLLTTVKYALSKKGRAFILYPTARTSEFRLNAEIQGFNIISEVSELTSTRDRISVSGSSSCDDKSKTVFIVNHRIQQTC